MSLILEITRADGSLVRQPLAADTPLAIHAGDRIRVMDAASGQALPPEALQRDGADLLIASGDERFVARGLFEDDADGEVIGHALAGDGDGTAPVEAQSLVAIAAGTGDPAMIAAANGAAAASTESSAGTGTGAGANEGASPDPDAGGPGPFDDKGTVAFGALGAAGIALVIGGSSGGSSSAAPQPVPEPEPEPQPQPGDTTPPLAPVLAPLTGDNLVNAAEAGGVLVSGTAEAGSKVSVQWTDGATVVSGSAMADASGAFAITLDPAALADGPTTVSATATDTAGNVGPAASLAVAIDRVPPAAPTVALDAASDSGVPGDGITNVLAPTLSGTTEAGAIVSVTYVDAGGTARGQSTTADSGGAWSMAIAHGVAGNGATMPFAVGAADAAGNPASTTASFVFDTVSMTPSLRVDLATGAAHGVAEAGATVMLDHDGDAGTAALSTVAGADGAYAFAPGTLANAGQVASATATDVAGNTSAAATVTMPAGGTSAGETILGDAGANTIVGLGGDDTLYSGGGNDRIDGGHGSNDIHGDDGDDILIGGPGDDGHISGGDGNDVLVGDSGGAIRNYQFDYWDTSAPDTVDSGDAGVPVELSYAGLRSNAAIGWVIDPSPEARMIDDGAGGNVQVHTGGLVELLGTANTANDGPDQTGTGGTLYWETEFTGSDGASALSQPVITSAGVGYELAMQTSSFDGDTSFAVVWNGQEIAFYNGLTNAWSGQQPGITPVSPGDPNVLRQVLRFEVDGNPSGEDSSLALRAFAPIGQDGGDGLQVDRVTLRPTAADGNDVMDGGAGDDLLFGQGGDDTLTGGSGADSFVYSMQADNGNDIIWDFAIGVDRILLLDALDAHSAGSLGPAGVPLSDSQLDASDFLVAGTQEIVLADDAGNLRLVFSGEGGATLGSVTLNGVAAGTYADVGSLFSAGILQATGDGFHTGLP